MEARPRTMTRLASVLFLICWLAASPAILGAPPHPQLLEQTGSGKQAVPYFMTNMDRLRAAGLNSGISSFEEEFAVEKWAVETSLAVEGEFKILAILVQFTDNNSATSAAYYDDLLYDVADVSVRHYYGDASYGQLDIVTVNMPSTVGWQTAPQTYAYYVNGESGVNPESYPHNSQKLVEDLVGVVDPFIDFSSYDNDNNGFVDVFMVIHAGRGAEVTGSDDDMWSHQWAIYPRSTNDGVYVSNFTMQPEYLYSPGDMTIGVFAHELGHAFGLPDLYDTDYSSNGIGSWGIMSYGSWLGPHNNGGLPAHPSAWSRIQMGFTDPTIVTGNIDGQAIEDVKTSGDVFRLWTAGNTGDEYFLVENRQKTGYDSYLPAAGLLIWHIDENKSSNDDEWYPGLSSSDHYLVALEQCDGLYELEHSMDMGDANDVFPSFVSTFNASSPTTSNSYSSGPTLVAVENVSSPAATMYADFKVSLTSGSDDDTDDGGGVLPDRFTVRQNYPNPFNPSTTISFYTPSAAHARVTVYNILGEVVSVLLDEDVAAGNTEVEWDGRNDSGSSAASGIYLYLVKVGGQTQMKKMILVR